MVNKVPEPTNDILFDVALVGDTNADHELNMSAGVESLSDDEIDGARLQIVRRAVERVTGGIAVALDVFFQPPDAVRFTYARIILKLVSPDGTVFQDVVPVEIRDDRAVEFEVENNATPKLTIKVKDVEVGGELTRSSKAKYTQYACLVNGTGVATNRADWRFEENKVIKDGLGRSGCIAFTLPEGGPFEMQLTATFELTKPGLKGALDRIRTLMLGPTHDKTPVRTITIEAPGKTGGWFFS